jgi:splicing factor 3B subunit 3
LITEKSNGTIRFLSPIKLGETFSQQITKLRYSPRSISIHTDSKAIIVCETEKTITSDRKHIEQNISGSDSHCISSLTNNPNESTEPNKWHSCIRVVDAENMESKYCTELDNDESVVSTTMMLTTQTEEKNDLYIVGSVINQQSSPRRADICFIRVYIFLANLRQLKLLSKTRVEDFPTALAPFNGCLLAGIASTVRLYKIGKKRVLRKAEFKGIPNLITNISHIGKRIYVSDVQESVFILKYRPKDNDIHMIADDSIKRFVTSMCLIDYDTVAVGDKFGNLSILRLPADSSHRAEQDLVIRKADNSKNLYSKLRTECNFFVGDIVTSITKAKICPGGDEVLLYSTIAGGLSVLIPLTFKENSEFFQDLEMHMRQEAPPMLGMDHIAYRSYYFPCRHVIDGDLCEMFTTLKRNLQDALSVGLERKLEEVLKKVEEMRNKIS